MKKLLTGCTLALTYFSCFAYDLTFREKQIDPDNTNVYLYVALKPHEVVYEKEILLSVDNPLVESFTWEADKKPAVSYDPHFKEQRTVYDHSFTIEVRILKKTFSDDAQTVTSTAEPVLLYVTMASNQAHKPEEKIFPITFAKTALESSHESLTSSLTTEAQELTQAAEQSWEQWSQALKGKITATQSLPMRLLFCFLLGVLLSLTPCIYPMIPITVGILQTQGTSSVLRNFLLSSCYALGLGTTFSLMGFLAASSGQAFGHLLGNPIFVVSIVLLLCYFAFSLFGFYNLYIPRFMQNKGSYTKSGSAVSIFFFGMASGTFASPCLSPGLALILALVASMANKLAGLVLLFCFGLGLSMPLVIIGTFSSSINLLPRAGTWMLEVQKIFGFLLLGMCFYYLSAILPWYMILMMLTVFFLVVGIYYLRTNPSNFLWRLIKNVMGSLCIIACAFLTIQAIHELYYPEQTVIVDLPWYTNYEEAVAAAENQNKKLFIDFSTPYCSICSAITKTVLKDKDVSKVLQDSYVLLAVDASDSKVEPYKTLRTKYDIQGVPTILIVDPTTGQESKRWMSELYGTKQTQVIGDLKTHAIR